ncbi:MAG TPA: Ku protein [Candidatus Sumerlaeota bacterium]|nr:Ku protein [Candidatus Sumerlaeota bacterium]
MARPIWKGNITFGLVNIPVTLYSAEKRNNLHFNLVDSRNRARVRYERVNEVTGEEVPWSEIVKAFEYDGDDYVLLTDEDFQKAAVENSQAVEIESFVDLEAIQYPYFDKPYYLVPGKKGEKGYVLLRETLKRTGKVGIAKVVIRTRQHLAALVPQGDGLVLDLLRFQQELRDLDEFDLPTGGLKQYKVSDKELKLAEQLVEAMSAEWDPAEYHDDYRDKLMAFIEKKARSGKGAEPLEEEPEEKEEQAEVVDMMELLQRSMKGGAKKEQAGKSARKAPAKKAARKRAAG